MHVKCLMCSPRAATVMVPVFGSPKPFCKECADVWFDLSDYTPTPIIDQVTGKAL